MRDMKTRFISFFLFMLTMSCFVACSSDDPAPEPEPEPEPEPPAPDLSPSPEVIAMEKALREEAIASKGKFSEKLLNRRALYTYV